MSLNVWIEGSTHQPTCLICGTEVQFHGICNGCQETGRRLDERAQAACSDCDVTPPCVCEIADGIQQQTTRADATNGRR